MSLWSLGTATALRGTSSSRASLDSTSPPSPASVTSIALASLAKYIPAETTTAFLAALALLPVLALSPIGDIQWTWLMYCVFALLTPMYVYLAARAAWRASSATLPKFTAPIWRMVAALVAFSIWALAVPGMLENKGAAALAGFAAVFVSPLIVMFEKAFGLDR